MGNSNSQISYVIPSDFDVLPVSELSGAERNALKCESDDVIIDRTRHRTRSKLVSGNTALLLDQFRIPKTISDAVVSFSIEIDRDPRTVLEEAFAPISELVQSEYLIPANRPVESESWNGLSEQSQIGPFKILRQLRVVGETAVYLARDEDGSFAAVKVLGPGATEVEVNAFDVEAECLSRISHLPVPQMLAYEKSKDIRYLALSWINGVPVVMRADEIREQKNLSKKRLLNICQQIAALYTKLHAAGVLHGDVRSSNILIDKADRVFVIDFAMSKLCSNKLTTRSWAHESLEPEAARRMLAGEAAPTTELSEQFAIGVLLYRLVSGKSFRVLPPRESDAIASIASENVYPSFASRGGTAWPELESLLQRATASNPSQRYPSVEAFSDSLNKLCIKPTSEKSNPISLLPNAIEFLRSCRPDVINANRNKSELLPVTVHDGAAGISWAQYRAAQILEDGDLFALSHYWAIVANEKVQSMEQADRKSNKRLTRSSPYHDVAGPAAVNCLIAKAQGNYKQCISELSRFLSVTASQCELQEVFLGNAGHLAVSTVLYGALENIDSGPELETSMMRLLNDLGSWVERTDRSPASCLPHLGVAHGWAGLAYVGLIACRQLSITPVAWIEPKLKLLADASVPVGRGVAWKGTIAHRDASCVVTPSYAPGWCSGSAGYVMLWLEAYRTFGDPRYRDLAMEAAWHVFDHPDDSPGICCGLAGRSLSLFKIYRSTNQQEWLDRADLLLARAWHQCGKYGNDHSLFRGKLGLALAIVERERPALSVMPLLEPESWVGSRGYQ